MFKKNLLQNKYTKSIVLIFFILTYALFNKNIQIELIEYLYLRDLSKRFLAKDKIFLEEFSFLEQKLKEKLLKKNFHYIIDEDEKLRKLLYSMLSYAEINQKEFIPFLTQNFEHKNKNVKLEIILLALTLDMEPKKIHSLLTEILQNEKLYFNPKNCGYKMTIIFYIGKIGKDAESDIPLLLKAYEDEKISENKLSILNALMQIGLPPKELLKIIKKILETEKFSFPYSEFRLLESMGSNAMEIIPSLIKIIENYSHPERVRKVAKQAFKAITGKEYKNFR